MSSTFPAVSNVDEAASTLKKNPGPVVRPLKLAPINADPLACSLRHVVVRTVRWVTSPAVQTWLWEPTRDSCERSGRMHRRKGERREGGKAIVRTS